MQEFSSISVSSYEAGLLADRLTEQSREGWEVVAIVPTGSTVTAFLSREATTADEQIAASTEHAEAAAVVVPEAASEPEAGAGTNDADEVAAPEAESTDEAGWAALASEVAATADDDSPALPERDSAVDVAAATEVVAATEVAAATDVAAATEAASAAADTSAETATASAAASGAAPAGWYADPSSRFELRYWDGNQWTEHVSRAGQQYTDPPVA